MTMTFIGVQALPRGHQGFYPTPKANIRNSIRDVSLMYSIHRWFFPDV